MIILPDGHPGYVGGGKPGKPSYGLLYYNIHKTFSYLGLGT